MAHKRGRLVGWVLLLLAVAIAGAAAATPRQLFLVTQAPVTLTNHHGQLLTGNYSVNLLWYGRFTPAQRATVADFLLSMSSPSAAAEAAAVLDASLSLGRRLSETSLAALAARLSPHRGSIAVVITAPRCPRRRLLPLPLRPPRVGHLGRRRRRHRLASRDARARQGPTEAPLEAVTACTGMFGAGAYPGYPGQLPVDAATGASYNAVGVAGRRFLLPAMWDPKTSQCSTLV
uniref:Uncharacterized protein n=1 Tax=Oryza barthii TaxID=65489 RepID=A0A0D3H1I4_9ORYZ